MNEPGFRQRRHILLPRLSPCCQESEPAQHRRLSTGCVSLCSWCQAWSVLACSLWQMLCMQGPHPCFHLLAQPECIHQASCSLRYVQTCSSQNVQALFGDVYQHSLARSDETLLLCPVYHIVCYSVLYAAQKIACYNTDELQPNARAAQEAR